MGLVKPDKDVSRAKPAEPVVDVATLLGTLEAEQPKARREAARALAGVPSAVGPLCARLDREEDPRTREVILTSLIRIHLPEVVEGLIGYVRSEDAGLRNDVVEALGEMPDLVEPHIDALLKDADPDVRILTVNILAILRHRKVPHWLAAVAERDAHPNVCAAAIDVLADVGSAEALPVLERVRARFADLPFLVFAVDVAMRRIDGAGKEDS